jgi:hypothetical protein
MTETAIKTMEETQSLVPVDVSAAALEAAVGMGDFSRLAPEQRLKYLGALCRSVGLNPLTLPIQIIKIDGKEVLYARAECAAQLRKRDSVSIIIVERWSDHGCYFVRVKGSTPDGRVDEATGAVALVYPEKVREWRNGQSTWVNHPQAGKELGGIDYANAVKKAETQAKRRVALSICGLGLMDESEVHDDGPRRANAPGQVIENTETAHDRAETLTNFVQTPVEAEVIPQSQPGVSNEDPKVDKAPETILPVEPAKPEAPLTAQQGTKTANLGPAAPGLPAETVAKVKAVIETRDGKPTSEEFQLDCKSFLQARGELKTFEADLSTLRTEMATRIITKPVPFYRAVETWAKSAAPATT